MSTDTAQKNKEFAESLGADYPILADPDKKAADPYGVLMPLVGYAKRWTFYIGKDGKVLFIDKDVKVDTAGADIAAKLASWAWPAGNSRPATAIRGVGGCRPDQEAGREPSMCPMSRSRPRRTPP